MLNVQLAIAPLEPLESEAEAASGGGDSSDAKNSKINSEQKLTLRWPQGYAQHYIYTHNVMPTELFFEYVVRKSEMIVNLEDGGRGGMPTYDGIADDILTPWYYSDNDFYTTEWYHSERAWHRLGCAKAEMDEAREQWEAKEMALPVDDGAMLKPSERVKLMVMEEKAAKEQKEQPTLLNAEKTQPGGGVDFEKLKAKGLGKGKGFGAPLLPTVAPPVPRGKGGA